MLRDGHIHTYYCPHGSNDLFEHYIERAIALGFTEITFTEHAPLPDTFIDPAPARDSCMRKEDLDSYIKDVERFKKKYASSLKINTGLEVDFISGYEKETTRLLSEYGAYLDDSILSVHFLPLKNEFVCIDYSEQEFERIIHEAGSIENVYELYYDTVLQSIQADLGAFKPSRIGHITLVHKFQRMFPCQKPFDFQIGRILKAVKQSRYSLDYNGAGFVKPLCRETYPPFSIAQSAHSLGIPLIYGSDAHAAAGLGQGLEQIDRTIIIEGSV